MGIKCSPQGLKFGNSPTCLLPRLRKTAYFLAAGGFTSAMLFYAFWEVDFFQLGRLLAGSDFRYLAPFFVFLSGFYLFTAWRWKLILRPLGKYTLSQTIPAMMIGFAGNNIFPAHMGELARAMVFARRFGLSVSGVFASLVVERVLDVFAILFFYLLAIFLTDSFPDSIRLGAEVAASVAAAGCVAIVLFLSLPKKFLALYWRITAWAPDVLREKGATILQNTVVGMSALKSPGILLKIFCLSLAKWVLGGGMVWLALAAFETSISFSVTMIVIAVSALAVTVPSAPGYLGALQAAFVFALVPFGVPQEVALAASVFSVVAQWIPVTLLGGVCFAVVGIPLAQISRFGSDRGEMNPEPKAPGP